MGINNETAGQSFCPCSRDVPWTPVPLTAGVGCIQPHIKTQHKQVEGHQTDGKRWKGVAS